MKKIYTFLISILIILLIYYRWIQQTKYNEELSIDDKIDSIMDNMSIEEKIAQMLIIYSPSNKIDETLINILQSNPPGGFIIGKSNITTYDKTRQYISDLKRYSDIPLIISIAEEGGSIRNLKYLQDVSSINIPNMYYIGKTNNNKLAYNIGKILAENLKSLGINVTFAPVANTYSELYNKTIDKRSFGSNPILVSNMVDNITNGLEDNGITATVKYFPGVGNINNTNNIPILDKNYQQLKQEELIPFQSAINKDIKLIMVGHVSLPKVTGNNTPASLSKDIVTNLLTDKMGYKGLIITDILNNNYLNNTYTEEQIYTMAINAGNDILLMPRNMNHAITYIKKNISEERINKSVKKILTFKYTQLNNKTLDKSYLNNEEQQYIINQISK